MTSMYKMFGVAAVALVLLLAGAASATFVVEAVGDPVTTGSFTSAFTAFQVAGDTGLTDPFDFLEIGIVSGGPPNAHFEFPPSTNFVSTTSGWHQVFASPTLVAGMGPTHTGAPGDRVNFSLNFTDNLVDFDYDHPLQVLVAAWLVAGDFGTAEFVASMDGYFYHGMGGPVQNADANTWTFSANDEDEGPPPVPEPVSMVMLGCLGAGMMGARRLRRRK